MADTVLNSQHETDNSSLLISNCGLYQESIHGAKVFVNNVVIKASVVKQYILINIRASM